MSKLFFFTVFCCIALSCALKDINIGKTAEPKNAKDGDNLVVRVALLQMMPSKDNNQTYNTLKAIDFCNKAKQQYNADIALMPEMWNVGYTIGYPGYNREDPSGHEAWLAGAVSESSDYIKTFQDLAQKLNMAIGATYLQTWDPLPRNSISLIDRFGNIKFTYAKVHTCDWLTSEGSTTPGTDWYTTHLNTSKGNVTIGSFICYDREHPESAIINMLKGAEVVLTPNACFLDQLRLDQYKTRAFENAMGMAMTNYPAPMNNGKSVAFSHEANLLVEAGGDEGIYIADFDITKLREFRKTSIWGDAFRRPLQYGYITTQGREPSFMAPNGFQRARLG